MTPTLWQNIGYGDQSLIARATGKTIAVVFNRRLDAGYTFIVGGFQGFRTTFKEAKAAAAAKAAEVGA